MKKIIISLILLALSFAFTSNAYALDSSASLAANRVVKELRSNNGMVSSSSDSTGLTIDAVIMLAAVGIAKDDINSALNNVKTKGLEWAQDASVKGDEGRTAKLIFILKVAGEDTTSLEALLRGKIQENGRFGTATNPFGQAWGVMALSKTAEGVPEKATEYLLSLQCTTAGATNFGGFGFSDNGCTSAEGDSTGMGILALLALGKTAESAEVKGAVSWLKAHQLADGSFSAQLAPKSGNANSTGIAANALRAVGTVEAVALADAAALYVKELQVTCQSPLIVGNDTSLGGGFIYDWIGSFAYNAKAQDSAIENGIVSGQYTQWTYATLQAALALPGVSSIANLSLDNATTQISEPPCERPKAKAKEGKQEANETTSGKKLPAVKLKLKLSQSVIVVGTKSSIAVSGLSNGENVTLTLTGRVVGKGVANGQGVANISILVPKTFAAHPKRILRAIGANPARTEYAYIATVKAHKLKVVAAKTVKENKLTKVTVSGLVFQEQVTIRIGKKIVARGKANQKGIASVQVHLNIKPAKQKLIACGASCVRTGFVIVKVKR